MKRTPLRRRSKKKEKQDEEYYAKRKEFLEGHPFCQVCEAEGWPRRRATDVHHKEQGRGSKTNDVSLWISICRPCHQKVHFGANEGFGPRWSRERGYLI